MADVVPRRRRSEIMAGIGSKDTTPEMLARSALHKAGCRYRLHDRSLPGTPDVVLAGPRIALFIHGCFWHHHDCPAGRVPKTNVRYWRRKFARNAERDAEATALLRKMGWMPVVVWECELRKDADAAVAEVARIAKRHYARKSIAVPMNRPWTG